MQGFEEAHKTAQKNLKILGYVILAIVLTACCTLILLTIF